MTVGPLSAQGQDDEHDDDDDDDGSDADVHGGYLPLSGWCLNQLPAQGDANKPVPKASVAGIGIGCGAVAPHRAQLPLQPRDVVGQLGREQLLGALRS